MRHDKTNKSIERCFPGWNWKMEQNKKKSSAALVKSGPLDFPSENIFLLHFAHEKASWHMFKK